MNTTRKYGGLLGWLLLCAGAGLIGAYFEPGSWYQMIQKPSFTPPDWVFPIVWPVLYACMAVAAWGVWEQHGFERARRPLKWFGVQLALNAAWSWLFFGRHNIGAALAEIVLLWSAILFTILLFWQYRRWTAWLLIPYLVWITYAVALNYGIWELNG